MRTFIAIEFENYIKEYLWAQQQLVKEYSQKGNFTRLENFHLTLHFLGEVSPQQIESLKKVIQATVLHQQPFSLQLDRLGQFSKGNTQIIWVGIKKSIEVEGIYDRLQNELAGCGFPKEDRGLKPHITLAREIVLKGNFNELSQQIQIQPKEIFVDKLSLMESTRVNGQLAYIPIYSKHF